MTVATVSKTFSVVIYLSIYLGVCIFSALLVGALMTVNHEKSIVMKLSRGATRKAVQYNSQVPNLHFHRVLILFRTYRCF